MIETLFQNNLPQLHINFTDKLGNVTQRTIRPLGVRRIQLTHEAALIAHCLLRDQLRTFALPRTHILNIDTDEDSARLNAAVENALKRHDTFNLLRHGHMRNARHLPQSNLVHIARVNMGLPLNEGLVSWDEEQTLIDIDAQSADAMREQTGHQFFKTFTDLNHFAQRIRATAAHHETGFIAFWQTPTDANMVLSTEHAYC